MNNLQGAYQIVDWVHPGHPVLFLLQIVPRGNGIILFIFFICKASNRELVAKMLPTILQKPTSSAKSGPMPLAMVTWDTKSIKNCKLRSKSLSGEGQVMVSKVRVRSKSC